ncbi:VapE domain-containing protein [Bacillus cereus]|uniref:VapE domain-containing protein n=1 Tax=Bacillus cereus TaxID=1396 RepID=UPI001F0B1E97|nr:VapE domain-containing protein [Bacillus cereus]
MSRKIFDVKALREQKEESTYTSGNLMKSDTSVGNAQLSIELFEFDTDNSINTEANSLSIEPINDNTIIPPNKEDLYGSIEFILPGAKILKLKGYSNANNGETEEEKYSIAKTPMIGNFTKEDFIGMSQKEATDWIFKGGWLGVVIPKGRIVVDVDDHSDGILLKNALESENVKHHAIRTPNGYQFIIRDSGHIKTQTAKFVTRLGIVVDYRIAGKGYIVFPSHNTENRKVLTTELEELSELPQYLQPVWNYKKNKNVLSFPIEDGGRNDAINEWAFRLRSMGISHDDTLATMEVFRHHLMEPAYVGGDCEDQFYKTLNSVFGADIEVHNTASILKNGEQVLHTQEEPKVQNEIDFKRNSKNKILVKAENTKKLLDSMGIEVYYDVIRKREYLSSLNLYFDGEIADYHAQGIIEEAIDRGYFITKDRLIDHLLYLASCNKKNKVAEYFLNVSKKWDGQSRIEEVFATLNVRSDRELGIAYLKKWAIQAVKLAFNESGKINQEFVLVLQGSQGCGKTFWFRLLFSSLGDDYFKTGKRLNPENKDSVIEAISNFAVELGELDSTMKFEQAALKAFFTENFDEFRRPYQRLSVKYPRMTVFFATVNDEEFLKDKTGNRRYAVINVGDKISDLKAIDIDQFWGEIATMALKDDSHLLTNEEAQKQKEHNEESELQTHEEIEILSGFSWGASKDLWTWKSNKVIFKELNLTNNTKNAGTALKKYGAVKKQKGKDRERGWITPPFAGKPSC